jgi:hypothetical protein
VGDLIVAEREELVNERLRVSEQDFRLDPARAVRAAQNAPVEVIRDDGSVRMVIVRQRKPLDVSGEAV